jgi:hypothetical protein
MRLFHSGKNVLSLLNCITGNAPAREGQAENPPEPVWAFGWFNSLLTIAIVTSRVTQEIDAAYRNQCARGIRSLRIFQN